MKYIRQVVQESQIKYPGITRTPLDYFRHLFFVNGNGIEFREGNPVIMVGFNKIIPFQEYYKDHKSIEEMKEYFDIYIRGDELEKTYQCKLDFNDIFKQPEDELWDESIKEVDSRLDNMLLISDVSDEDLVSKEFYKKLILDSKYIPHLGLSEDYYKLDKFTKDTETSLLKIGLVISEAYKEVFESYIKDKTLYENLKNPFGRHEQDFESIFIKDSELLRKNISDIKHFIES